MTSRCGCHCTFGSGVNVFICGIMASIVIDAGHVYGLYHLFCSLVTFRDGQQTVGNVDEGSW
ncbi:hypothetical protein BDV41DRAFT_516827 [Aspergillus transmontanensis]|uniref:Uncharacterized protein n=1 Tax=Aspergillus transmontanensis TaxID=1034304 RepID=A0A5N6WH84_9EURO|nr:hypothetical protein BDV41DRAFT_516827 [Aspergillus transmontanensis]